MHFYLVESSDVKQVSVIRLSTVSFSSGVWGEAPLTNDLVHIGVKKTISAGSSFCGFS